jgi:hypothetical protein
MAKEKEKSNQIERIFAYDFRFQKLLGFFVQIDSGLSADVQFLSNFIPSS